MPLEARRTIMSLDYVRKGEAVKASTVNSIIDTIGGN